MNEKNIIRICHVTSVHPLYDVRIFHKECVTLAENGYEVILLCAGADSVKKIVQKVHIITVRKNSLRFMRMIFTVWRLYKNAIKINAQIYHIHDPELLLLGLMLKKRGKEVVYDVHEDFPKQILEKYWIPSFLRKLISTIFSHIEQYSAKRMSYVITATDDIKLRFEKFTGTVCAVKNYPMNNEFETLNRPSISHENTICYIGGISEERGITTLVRAVHRLKNIRLILAGNFYTHSYYEKLKNEPGWKMVDFRGYVQRENLPEIYSFSSIGMVTLLPVASHLTALPIKMFEYMSVGLPVIASDFPLWRKIIEKNQCGLCVNPANPTEIAEAISFFLNNPEVAKEMGLNGKNAIQKLYNWENEKNKLLKVYQDITGKISV